MKEFKINDFITLRLEDDSTNIYVKDDMFIECKFLLLEIPLENITSFDEIKSVDEVKEKLNQYPKEFRLKKLQIPPDVEFWGHCSNLQVWAENNYNTNLIHSHLAFPLLKKLMEAGDIQAKRAFKEEIIKRIKSEYPPVVEYLIREGYTELLDLDDFQAIIGSEAIILKEIAKIIPLFLTLVPNDEFYNGGAGFVIEDQHIKKLSLDNCNIKKLPMSIGGLNYLESLILTSNNLTELPDTIGHLTYLTELSLYNNQLITLPASIGNLSSLKELWLAKNKLTELPHSMGNLTSLEILNVAKNSLELIPQSIYSLPSLKELWIKDNKIHGLPESVKKNPLIKIYR